MVVLLMVRAWWVRLLCVLYPLLTVAVIVSTGNHYVLDGVAGAAVALVAAVTVGLLPLHRGPAAVPVRAGAEYAKAT
jgi:membrane-associated phospholipid phosphatase